MTKPKSARVSNTDVLKFKIDKFIYVRERDEEWIPVCKASHLLHWMFSVESEKKAFSSRISDLFVENKRSLRTSADSQKVFEEYIYVYLKERFCHNRHFQILSKINKFLDKIGSIYTLSRKSALNTGYGSLAQLEIEIINYEKIQSRKLKENTRTRLPRSVSTLLDRYGAEIESGNFSMADLRRHDLRLYTALKVWESRGNNLGQFLPTGKGQRGARRIDEGVDTSALNPDDPRDRAYLRDIQRRSSDRERWHQKRGPRPS